jgi:hypothetical protein
VQLQVVVIDVEQAVAHFDITKTDALRDHFQRLPGSSFSVITR